MLGHMQVPAALAPIVDLIFPPRCPLCGAGLAAQDGLCAACWGQLALPGDPCCVACQRPFPDGISGESLCAPCLAQLPRHDGIAAGTLYNDASRRLVLAFKYGHRIALAPLLARLMLARLPQTGLPANADWLVVPVPLHRWRLWQRGYNQAALLAREIARNRGLALAVDGLVRTRATPRLGGLGAKARKRALTGSIALNPSWASRIKGRNVVLVDDVLTSGATSDACVSALKRAGAVKVVVCCFARVLDEALPLAEFERTDPPA